MSPSAYPAPGPSICWRIIRGGSETRVRRLPVRLSITAHHSCRVISYYYFLLRPTPTTTTVIRNDRKCTAAPTVTWTLYYVTLFGPRIRLNNGSKYYDYYYYCRTRGTNTEFTLTGNRPFRTPVYVTYVRTKRVVYLALKSLYNPVGRNSPPRPVTISLRARRTLAARPTTRRRNNSTPETFAFFITRAQFSRPRALRVGVAFFTNVVCRPTHFRANASYDIHTHTHIQYPSDHRHR